MKRILDTFSKTSIAHILGVIIVLGSFFLVCLLIIKPIPTENKDVVNIAVGFIMGGALAGVTGYFYGASKQPDKSNT